MRYMNNECRTKNVHATPHSTETQCKEFKITELD